MNGLRIDYGEMKFEDNESWKVNSSDNDRDEVNIFKNVRTIK